MTARDELDLIERSTDWPALIEMAMADPPNPSELLFHFNQWAWTFKAVYGGEPLEPDFPEPMRAFFRRLAGADYPPELMKWIDTFEAKHGRKPKIVDIPRSLRSLIPGDTKKGGRPRLDTKRWRDARAAWTAEVLKGSYEARRDGIAMGKECGFVSCFGYSQFDMNGDRPSSLAIEKLSEETGLSESRLADLMGHRKPK